MFDFDAGKLIIIGIVALIVIGPKDLPRVLRQLGQALAKMRRLAADFQGQFMEAMKEADMADLKADMAKLSEAARIDAPANPLHDIKTQLDQLISAEPEKAAKAEAPTVAALLPASANRPADSPANEGAAPELETPALQPSVADAPAPAAASLGPPATLLSSAVAPLAIPREPTAS
jgi:sec-independent protein translocase protein TatB